MSIKDFKPPKDVAVTPGTGKVNFREVMARARKGGFKRGPLVVECLDPSTEMAAVTSEARYARRMLEGLSGGWLAVANWAIASAVRRKDGGVESSVGKIGYRHEVSQRRRNSSQFLFCARC